MMLDEVAANRIQQTWDGVKTQFTWVWKGPNPLEYRGGSRRSKIGGGNPRTSIFSNFRDARAGSSHVQLNRDWRSRVEIRRGSAACGMGGLREVPGIPFMCFLPSIVNNRS